MVCGFALQVEGGVLSESLPPTNTSRVEMSRPRWSTRGNGVVAESLPLVRAKELRVPCTSLLYQ